MAEDHFTGFARLQARADALAAEFAAVKGNHEAGLMPFDEALARHKAIAAEAHMVAVRMRHLLPDRSNPAPLDPQ